MICMEEYRSSEEGITYYSLSCLQVKLPHGQSKHPIPYPQQKTRFHHAGRPPLVASPGYHSS